MLEQLSGQAALVEHMDRWRFESGVRILFTEVNFNVATI